MKKKHLKARIRYLEARLRALENQNVHSVYAKQALSRLAGFSEAVSAKPMPANKGDTIKFVRPNLFGARSLNMMERPHKWQEVYAP
jgi:hypothetical protein